MSEKRNTLTDDFVERVRELSQHVDAGNELEVDRILDQIAKMRESSLFQELGKLTREFHEALNSFRLDARITNFTEKEFPDARERLRHVVHMTAQSADRTLTAAEESLPICNTIEDKAGEFKQQWERFTHREMSAEEFRQLSARMSEFFDSLKSDSTVLKNNMNDVIMAQDFQDLTGQIIERVIILVDEMESSLVDLIRISGQNLVAQQPAEKKGEEEQEDQLKATGPAVPGVDAAENLVSGQDEVDDLLSSLGF
jgi:chemotaxis protein CheZ